MRFLSRMLHNVTTKKISPVGWISALCALVHFLLNVNKIMGLQTVPPREGCVTCWTIVGFALVRLFMIVKAFPRSKSICTYIAIKFVCHLSLWSATVSQWNMVFNWPKKTKTRLITKGKWLSLFSTGRAFSPKNPYISHVAAFSMTSIHISHVAAAHRGEPAVPANTRTSSAGLSSFPSELWKLQNMYHNVTAVLFLHLIAISTSTCTIIHRHSHHKYGQYGSSKQSPTYINASFLHLLIIIILILFAAARSAQHQLPEHQLHTGDLSWERRERPRWPHRRPAVS